jgi:CheY-like chemotaxis protein
MDLQMPVLDGYAATSQLRLDGYKKPIIALTAHALTQERMHCLANGFDDHVTKPISRHILLQSIARHSGRESRIR